MCDICNISKNKKDILLNSDKWVIYKDGLKGGLAVWKKHTGLVDCDNCLLWIQLKCRELFGEDCKYRFNYGKAKRHFHFYVSK